MRDFRQTARAGAPFLLLLLTLPAGLSAQPASPPIIETPLGPPGTTQSPSPPAPSPAPGQAVPAPASPPAPPAGPQWLPRHTAELQILDKVDATHETRDVAVGASVTVGEITIAVAACLVRPPDQQRDAAAYVNITDKNSATAPFHGWLLAAEPSVSVFEHPIYDVRVTGCR
ncbi:MAG TPA: DUF2155 domain-containing protein [Acetobacteraceae bacterium]|jgi:hypothetical protein|nr:DUF2155 domain-containing protein [Acetobacteraceae bacterium]